jgi:hypothetical protein
MDIRFKVSRRIPTKEQKKLFEWGTDIFGGAKYNLEWRPADYHVVGYLEKEPVTHVGIVKHSIRVGSVRKTVGGIGGVVTVPQKQKQGLAKMCLSYSHYYMRYELAVEYGFLFCLERLVCYYSDIGWRILDDRVLINQTRGTLFAPLCSMVFEFSDPWPKGLVTLDSLPW